MYHEVERGPGVSATVVHVQFLARYGGLPGRAIRDAQPEVRNTMKPRLLNFIGVGLMQA